MQLSVIIPIYNAEKYIKRCIESVYRQDLDINNFELLVVNDGSTDNSPSIVKELQKIYPNITLIDKENGGAASARNKGIDKATGEYLVFIDADDYYNPHNLKRLLETCKSESLDILYYRLLIHYEDGSVSDSLGGDYNGMPVQKVMSGLECYQRGFLASTMCACMIKRDILLANNLKFTNKRFGEDALLSYCVTAFANKVMFLNDTPYIYFKNNESVLQNVPMTLRLMQIEDTLGVGHDLQKLSLQVHILELSDILKKYSVNITFGAFWGMWKLRKIFKEGHVLYPFIDKLKAREWYPMRGPFFSFKKWIVAQMLINNKYFY